MCKLLPVHRLSGLVAWFERHPTRSFVAIGLLFALAYVTAHVWFPKPPGRVIDGDALGYYAWLRSVVFDGDINFSNDYRLLTDELAEDSGTLTPLATGLVPRLRRRPRPRSTPGSTAAGSRTHGLAAYLAELHDAGRAPSSAAMTVAAARFHAKAGVPPAS